MKHTLRNILFAGTVALCLTNCKDNTTIKMKTEQDMPETPSGSRYKIVRVGVFADDLAYDKKRGVYEITDTETGITYLGVSGIGITELGSHIESDGENVNIVPDER